jgi:hypothetical protein
MDLGLIIPLIISAIGSSALTTFVSGMFSRRKGKVELTA